MGLNAEKQIPIEVFYEDCVVGNYYADIIVNNTILFTIISAIIEVKAAESLCEEHELKLINYLKATEIEVGLLLNFGQNPEFKQKIFSNKRN